MTPRSWINHWNTFICFFIEKKTTLSACNNDLGKTVGMYNNITDIWQSRKSQQTSLIWAKNLVIKVHVLFCFITDRNQSIVNDHDVYGSSSRFFFVCLFVFSIRVDIFCTMGDEIISIQMKALCQIISKLLYMLGILLIHSKCLLT